MHDILAICCIVLIYQYQIMSVLGLPIYVAKREFMSQSENFLALAVNKVT